MIYLWSRSPPVKMPPLITSWSVWRLRIGGFRVKNSWCSLHGGEWSVGFQRKLLLYGRACAFLPLEQPSSFQSAFPGSNVEGKGEHVQLNLLFFLYFCTSFVISLFLVMNFVYVGGPHNKLSVLGESKRVRSGENCSPCRCCFFPLFFPHFFLLFKKKLEQFSYAWILGDEIGRVARSWITSLSRVL